MCDGFGHVPVESLFAVMAVASGGVMSAVHTHSSTLTARELIQLHVKATASSVQVTVTCYKKKREGEHVIDECYISMFFMNMHMVFFSKKLSLKGFYSLTLYI